MKSAYIIWTERGAFIVLELSIYSKDENSDKNGEQIYPSCHFLNQFIYNF